MSDPPQDECASGAELRPIILIIDDSEPLRRLMEMVLFRTGHRIITCVNRDEGIGILKENADVRLIISDFVMPGMDFREFQRIVERSYPMACVMCCSSESRRELERVGTTFPEDRYIAKPFHPEAFRRKVLAQLGLS